MAPPTPPPISPMDYFWRAPPFSRTLTALTLVISCAVYGGFLNWQLITLYPWTFLKLPPQLWRLFTSFALSRKDFGIIFDPYMLYTYGSQLETSSPRFPTSADFCAYILFLWVTIVGINWVFTGATIYTTALILAFAYTACQDNRGGSSTFIVLTIPTTWMPIAMLFGTFVLDGTGAAKVQATGLVAAHLHDFLTRIYPSFGGGRNILETPEFLKRIFASPLPKIFRRDYGTAIQPGQVPAQGSSSGVSTGNVLPESWKARGPGNRLGGD